MNFYVDFINGKHHQVYYLEDTKLLVNPFNKITEEEARRLIRFGIRASDDARVAAKLERTEPSVDRVINRFERGVRTRDGEFGLIPKLIISLTDYEQRVVIDALKMYKEKVDD